VKNNTTRYQRIAKRLYQLIPFSSPTPGKVDIPKQQSPTHRIQQLSITVKFSAGIGILLLLILLIAATGYYALILNVRANESIQISTETQRLVLEMDRGLEKARRLHGDFFLHYPEIGLTKAHETYAQPSIRQIARVITASNSLRMVIERSTVNDTLRKSHTDLNLYLSSAKRFADTSIKSFELVTKLATPNIGLEDKLDQHLNTISTELAPSEDLLSSFYNMKSYIQDYRIKRKRFLMQSAFNAAFTLRNQLDNEHTHSQEKKNKINKNFDQCLATAEAILRYDTEIKAKLKDFALQAEIEGPISNTLIHLANEEVAKSKNTIQQTYKIAFLLFAVITCIGFITALRIATILNNTITRRVISLTRATDKLMQGDSEVTATVDNMDELGQLAGTFNIMAAKINDLISTLEKTVEQRTAELAASEKRYRQLFEHSNNGMIILQPCENNTDYIVKNLNNSAERIENKPRHELIGKTTKEIFSDFDHSGLHDLFRQVSRTGESIRHCLTFRSASGEKQWRENSIFKLPSDNIIFTYDDISAQKQAESEKQLLENQLQRAKKMEAIGLLAGGVAHDLNNILLGIIGYPEILLKQLPKESELREPLMAIREAGKRAAAVVADLLTVARGVANTKHTACPNNLITEYINSPDHYHIISKSDRISCTLQLDPKIKYISCSPIHIKKCLMNLVLNGFEAIESNGQIVIATTNRDIDTVTARKHGITPGKYVSIIVSDNGQGIAHADMEHIFEPFYTKKVMGRSGTGLGLAVVWNTIKDHLGFITAHSNTNGTSFEIAIPATDKEITAKGVTIDPDAYLGNGETILIVDDEVHILDIGSRMLKNFGYEVIEANSGENAVELLKSQKVDLILLDMIMDPGINGLQTYKQILEMHPQQKAIIVSGYSKNEDIEKLQQLGAKKLIKKPFSLTQLGLAIKEELTS